MSKKKHLRKMRLPVLVGVPVTDQLYNYFQLTILLHNDLVRSVPNFPIETFADIFPKEEYLASQRELGEKLTKPKTDKVDFSIMNTATLLAYMDKVCKALLGPGSEQFKAVAERSGHMYPKWDIEYLSDTQRLFSELRDMFQKHPELKTYINRVTENFDNEKGPAI